MRLKGPGLSARRSQAVLKPDIEVIDREALEGSSLSGVHEGVGKFAAAEELQLEMGVFPAAEF